MRAPLHLVVPLVLLGIGARSSSAEDMQLRARAVDLLNVARAVSSIRGGPYIIRTEATFSASTDDGSLRSGSYTRLRLPTGSLRQDLRFGDWQATNILVDREVSTLGPWNYPPFAVRRLLDLVPFQVAQFDHEDVVRAVRDGSAAGQQATCVDYDTVHGERHSSNELCVSKADGTLLSVREQGRTYQYSHYASVVGASYPQHIDYREGNDFSLSLDLHLIRLDSAPDGAFTVPAGAQSGMLCKTASAPVPLRAPQPEAKGGPDAPVTDVQIRLYVSVTGSVSQPELSRAGRPDLDAEALKIVQTWLFQPSTCNGQPNPVPVDVTIHFQGR